MTGIKQKQQCQLGQSPGTEYGPLAEKTVSVRYNGDIRKTLGPSTEAMLSACSTKAGKRPEGDMASFKEKPSLL